MEIEYFGGNCVKLTTKKAAVTADDNLEQLGAKSITKPGDIALYTGALPQELPEAQFMIDMPGEYELSNVSIVGVAARAHIDEPE